MTDSDGVVLLVEGNSDDEARTLRVFQESHLANRMVVAGDGAGALDYLFGRGRCAGRDLNELPALILLEPHLSKIDGFEVLRRIRADQRTRPVPVIVFVGSDEERELVDALKLSFIQKPGEFRATCESGAEARVVLAGARAAREPE